SARGGATDARRAARGRPPSQMHRASAYPRVALRAVILQLQRRIAIVVDEHGVAVQVAGAPDGQRADDLAEILPARREGVGGPRRVLRIKLARHDAVLLEDLEAFRENVGRDAFERGEQVLEAARPGEQVADDEERPSFAEELERLGHRTPLTVPLGHASV